MSNIDGPVIGATCFVGALAWVIGYLCVVMLGLPLLSVGPPLALLVAGFLIGAAAGDSPDDTTYDWEEDDA